MQTIYPYIGITCDQSTDTLGTTERLFLKQNYIDAILSAGGVPILLPPVRDKNIASKLKTLYSGLLISGGDFDIHPSAYGEKPIKEIGTILSERTLWEEELLQDATTRNIPVLGICGGHQLINVHFGGSLYQDIATQYSDQINHESQAGKPSLHTVKIEESSKLFNILQTNQIEVNSTHHQAVHEVAPGFRVSARAKDNTIEGIEKKGQDFMVGIQWHPESLQKQNKKFAALFKEFIKEASLRTPSHQ